MRIVTRGAGCMAMREAEGDEEAEGEDRALGPGAVSSDLWRGARCRSGRSVESDHQGCRGRRRARTAISLEAAVRRLSPEVFYLCFWCLRLVLDLNLMVVGNMLSTLLKGKTMVAI